MAIRFDAAADRIQRTSDVFDYNSPYTCSMWFMIVSIASAGIASALFSVRSGEPEPRFDYLFLQANTATTMRLGFSTYDGSSSIDITGSTDISPNVWHHVGWIRTSNTEVLVYLDGALEVTHTHPSVSGRTASTLFESGAHTSSNFDRFDGRDSSLKIWAAALSLSELVQESRQRMVFRAANLHASYPMLSGATPRLLDFSGNGRNLSTLGTLTDEDDPAIPWTIPYHIVTPQFYPSASISPAAAFAVGQRANPSVVLSSISVAPTPAFAVGQRVNPSAVLGALNLAPNPATAVGERAAPGVVYGSTIATPAPAFVVGQRVNPSVTLGALSLAPNPATAVADRVNPAVEFGPIVVQPTPAFAVTDVVAPDVTQGSIATTPAPVFVVGDVVAPGVILGSLIVELQPAFAVARVGDPFVVGDVSIVLLTLGLRPLTLTLMDWTPDLTLDARDTLFDLPARPLTLSLPARPLTLSLEELPL